MQVLRTRRRADTADTEVVSPESWADIREKITNQIASTDSFGANRPTMDSIAPTFFGIELTWPLLSSIPATGDANRDTMDSLSMRRCLKFKKRGVGETK